MLNLEKKFHLVSTVVLFMSFVNTSEAMFLPNEMPNCHGTLVTNCSYAFSEVARQNCADLYTYIVDTREYAQCKAPPADFSLDCTINDNGLCKKN